MFARWARGKGRWVGELALVAAFCAIYELLRVDMVQDGAAAASHSLIVVHLEADLDLFHEEQLQSALLHLPNLVRFFNLYYGATHFLVPMGTLIWLAMRHPDRYRTARTALATATATAFACFWLFPVAPPRLLPAHYGIIDTLVAMGKSGHFESSLIDSAGDVYAAMPSLHVGWALWCTLALYPVVRHRTLRALLVLYPVLTTLVVVSTGNHFFLDAVTGSLLTVLTWMLVSRREELVGGFGQLLHHHRRAPHEPALPRWTHSQATTGTQAGRSQRDRLVS